MRGAAARQRNIAKTIADLFRYRQTVGINMALEGLREALRQHKATPAEIARYALAHRSAHDSSKLPRSEVTPAVERSHAGHNMVRRPALANTRPDLLGFGDPSQDGMLSIFQKVCGIKCDDGIILHALLATTANADNGPHLFVILPLMPLPWTLSSRNSQRFWRRSSRCRPDQATTNQDNNVTPGETDPLRC